MESIFLPGLVSASLQMLFDKLASYALPQIELWMNVDAELRKLQRSFLRIQAMVDFVESKNIGWVGSGGSSSKKAWQVWLEDLNNLLYETDDLLDEIYLNLSKSGEIDGNNKVNEILRSFLKSHKIGKLQNSLENMSNEMNLFFMSGVNKIEAYASDNTAYNDVMRKSLMVNDELIVGRESEKYEILSKVGSSQENIVVVPIVGMPGLGKTALARITFNELKHRNMKSIWISVSIKFDIERIMKSIIEAVTLECCNYLELNLIQDKVKQLLKDNQFVLVLDDYWSESHGDWEMISSLFNGGHPGSLVIVTTQSDIVSSIVGTVRTYRLQCLSDDDCWEIMRQRALLSGNITNNRMESMESMKSMKSIGKEISKKCKGLPLAAKALGSVMYHKATEKEWDAIKESDLWDLQHFKDEISPALLLSFNYLPVHLKKCFAYCSIFPPNHEFKREDLVLLWMAEGFIQPIKGIRLEDVGNDYFDDLLWRCFFQISGTSGYTMHNVFHLLAHMVSVDICLRIKVDDGSKLYFPSNIDIRHLSLHHDGPQQISLMKASRNLKGLRTLIVMSGNGVATEDLFSNYKLLRVLDLSNGIKEIPESIVLLNHLRYLDLSKGQMRKLPQQLTKLIGLQTLILRGCSNLRELPGNFSRLINLRHLDLDVKRQLNRMPRYFGRLVCLQQLSAFIVKEGEGYGIEQLKNMKSLRGTLRITNLENVSGDVTEGILDTKPDLEKLTLEWGNSLVKSETVTKLAESVLSIVKPHKNVKELAIVDYPGDRLPSWLYDPLAKLTTLNLTRCSCLILNFLGQLRFLKFLNIQGMPNLAIITALFCCSGNDNGGFPALKRLEFNDMPELTEWSGLTKSMPNLNEVKLIDCPKLQRVPTFVHLVLLQDIEFSGCLELESLPDLPVSLESLVITKCPIIKDRCETGEGADYHKVRQLPKLVIDNVEITLQDRP